MRCVRVLCLVALTLVACKIHRLPELPPARDPVAPEAPISDYEPPPDVLNEELSTGAKEGGEDPHAGHEGHEGHAPAPKPDAKEPEKPAGGHEHHHPKAGAP